MPKYLSDTKVLVNHRIQYSGMACQTGFAESSRMAKNHAKQQFLSQQNFRKWRKRANLTQDEVAGKIGKSASNISQIENGGIGYSRDTLASLAEAYGCTIGDLFSDPEGPDLPYTVDSATLEALLRCFAVMITKGGPIEAPVGPLVEALQTALRTKSPDEKTKEQRLNRIRLSMSRALGDIVTTKSEVPHHLSDRRERAVDLLLKTLPLADY